MELNKKQKERIIDYHREVLDEVIRENIDNDLIYTDDVYNILSELYDPFDILNGKVTMDDLVNDLYERHWDDEDTYIEVYDRLNDEQQEEINELADEE